MSSVTQKIICPVKGLEILSPDREYNPGDIMTTRWFNTGGVNTGKTSVAASIGGALMIDAEKKGRCAVSPKCHIVEVSTLDDMDELIAWLVADRCKTFPFVIFDTIDAIMSSLVIPGLTERLKRAKPDWAGKNPMSDITDYKSGQKGSGGWSTATNHCLGFLDQLQSTGYGWWVNGHQKFSEAEGLRPAVNPGVYGGIYRMAMFKTQTILRHETRTVKKTVNLGGKDKVIDQAEKVLVGELSVHTKIAGSTSPVMGNVALPEKIIVPRINAWSEVIVPAYQASIDAERASGGSSNE